MLIPAGPFTKQTTLVSFPDEKPIVKQDTLLLNLVQTKTSSQSILKSDAPSPVNLSKRTKQ